MSSEVKLDEKKLDEEKLDEKKLDEEDFDFDKLGVVGEGEEFVEQGEVSVEQGEVSVGQGDKQPDNKRKRSEWSEEFLTEQNKSTPEYIKQRQRSKERQEEGLRLKDVRLMNEEIGDFTEEDVKAIKRQKKTGGSRKKRSKSKTRSRKQSNTQTRSKSKTRSRKQKRSKNRRR